MINLFSKTKALFILGEAIAFLAAAALYHDGTSGPICILVFIALSIFVYIMMEANAAILYRKLLGLLYISENPLAFISACTPLLTNKYIRANVRFSLQAYLSNAYAASGDFNKALSLLNDMPRLPSKHLQAGKALVASNRCSIYTNMDDAGSAAEQYGLYLKLTNNRNGKQKEEANILRIKISLIEESATQHDADFIRNTLKKRCSPLYQAELQYLLGCIYLSLKENHFAKIYLSEAAKSDKQLWLSNKASEALKKT